MRCSSLSSEEDSFQLFGHDSKECFLSLRCLLLPFATIQILLTQSFLGSVLAVAWMKNRKKAKSKVALELELEKGWPFVNLHY